MVPARTPGGGNYVDLVEALELRSLIHDPLVIRLHVVDALRAVKVNRRGAARMPEDVGQALDVPAPLLPEPGERVPEEVTRHPSP